MSILIVAPHPDDEVLGCGGAILAHRARGEAVHVAVVTRGDPEVFDPAFIEQGRRELASAHAQLGVTAVHFLDFPAPGLDTVPSHRIADALGALVRKLSARTVYLPHGGDIHMDHRVVFLAGLVACRPLPGATVRRVLSYETLSETEWAPSTGAESFIPTVFLDISAHLPAKLAAMACYSSQLKPFPHPRSVAAVENLARLRGSSVGVAAAEAFALLRQVDA